MFDATRGVSYGPGPARRLGLPAAQRQAARQQAASTGGYAAVMNVPIPRPMRATSSRYFSNPMGFVRNARTMAVRTEKKVIDVNNTTFSVETTGTQLALLNGCVAGSQNFNRIGRKIQMSSLQIRGAIFLQDTTSGPTTVRMLIVYDRQANGAAPTYGDIIKSQNISGTTESAWNSFVNLDNRDRFEIIRDEFYEIGLVDTTATQAIATGPVRCHLNEYIKLGNREVVYNAGSAGTVGDIQSGSLYVFFISNQSNASGATAAVSFRTRFIDM